MPFFDGFLDGGANSALAYGGELLSNYLANNSAKNAAGDQRDFNIDMYNRMQTDTGNAATQDRLFASQMQANAMNYQKQMSDTSYQRAVGDLRKAGLNPMLSIMKGGASTPSASGGSSHTGTPQMSGAQQPQLHKAQGVQMALAARETASRIQLNLAAGEQHKALAQEAISRIPGHGTTVETNLASAAASRATAAKALQEVVNLKEQLHNMRQDRATSASIEALHMVEAQLKRGQITLTQAETVMKSIQSLRERYGLARDRAEYKMYTGPGGGAIPYLEHAGKIAGAGAAAAAIGALYRVFRPKKEVAPRPTIRIPYKVGREKVTGSRGGKRYESESYDYKFYER